MQDVFSQKEASHRPGKCGPEAEKHLEDMASAKELNKSAGGRLKCIRAEACI